MVIFSLLLIILQAAFVLWLPIFNASKCCIDPIGTAVQYVGFYVGKVFSCIVDTLSPAVSRLDTESSQFQRELEYNKLVAIDIGSSQSINRITLLRQMPWRRVEYGPDLSRQLVNCFVMEPGNSTLDRTKAMAFPAISIPSDNLLARHCSTASAVSVKREPNAGYVLVKQTPAMAASRWNYR